MYSSPIYRKLCDTKTGRPRGGRGEVWAAYTTMYTRCTSNTESPLRGSLKSTGAFAPLA